MFCLKQDEGGLCVASGQDPFDPTSELDPDLDDCGPIPIRFTPLVPCKNNCKGGI